MDLNDLRYFALVVQHGGFSAAERHTNISKSKLSRRIALMENDLGVRLLQRNTRRFSLTETGRIFYEHCAAMMIEAEAAQHAVEQLQSEPAGHLRMTCPTAMAQSYIIQLIANFMRSYPKVSVELDSSDRVVNLIDERIDIALRALDAGLREPGLVAKRIASGHMILVASPAYLKTCGNIDDPQLLSQFDTIGSLHGGAEQTWSLISNAEDKIKVTHRPRLTCSDFMVQYNAALSGVGIALLPERIVSPGIKKGALVHILEEWGTQEQDIHIVYASRRGMLPSVRAMIDYLTEYVPQVLTV
ncbi:LysR substrate-binding domain-containing protein [Tolumonas lignilytica]|uniref:LysR substrate-binding domain-containing protein n=1 Tax=Tolumonas lignilytica TaxID=1283284 RepID=UPI0004AE0180|nr:LysR substrate-binding domain-containing protein [Tolumonas lignilytica]